LWADVRLNPIGTSAIIEPTVLAPDYRGVWSIWWNENWQRKQKYSEKNVTIELSPPKIPHDLTWD
jgi:hypothetical protein